MISVNFMLLEQSPYVVFDPNIFYAGILQGMWLVVKTAWFPLSIIIILIVVSNILNGKIAKRNYKLKKQREDEEWDRRMEQFLEKRDRHDSLKK